MKFYCENIDTVLESTKSSAEGLTTAEAEKRLAENGKNKLKEGKDRKSTRLNSSHVF